MPVAALVLAACGAPASAGTYAIDQCRDAVTNSAKRVSADWSAQGPTKYDSCPGGGAFGYHLPGSYIPYGTDYWLHLTAPASLPEVSIERLQLHYRIPSHSGNLAFFEVRNGGSVRYGEQLPADHTASPIDVGMVAGARQVSLRHFCSTAYGGVNCNYTSSSEVLRITRARLTLREDAQPTATIDGGTLTQAGGRRGTETFTYSAGDNASGVERARVKLGPTAVAQTDFSPSCPRDDWAACQRTRNAQTLNVDTTQVADGGYPLTLEVTDAAANTRTVSGGTVVVDNVPPPSASAQPTVSGTARVGRTLTGTRGTWSGAGNTYTEQWERCEATDATSCTAITDADGLTYTATQDDAGRRLRLTVTATNGEGSTQASSAMTDVVVHVPPPANSQPPTVSGTARVGRTLTGDRGQWDSQTEVAYAYRWLRCDGDDVDACAAIDGADQPTYSAHHADVGKRLRLRVTATNDEGPTTADSAQSAAVVYIPPPENTEPPSVSGTPRVGRELTGDHGSWSSQTDVTYSHQWERCENEDAASCSAIAGATELRYSVRQADTGKRLRLGVTAENDEGQTAARSAPTDAAFHIPRPQNAARPELGGDPRARRTLTATRGSWDSQTDVTYAEQWQRCDEDGTACEPIAGATALTYKATGDDIGKRLRIRVTATNDEGSTIEHSDPSPVIADAPAPQNTATPTVSGEPRVGNRLTASAGDWSADAEVSYSYRWERCESAAVASCAAVDGADEAIYDVSAADVDRRLRVTVTATSMDGTTEASSDMTEAVVHPVTPSEAGTRPVDSSPLSDGQDAAGAANGRAASRRAAVTAAAPNGERLVRVRYGRTVDLGGTLANEVGQPIAGAEIDVLSVAAGGALEPLGSASTDEQGRYAYSVPVGPSRTIRLAYRAFQRDADYADAEDVTIRVTPTATLTAPRGATAAGRRATFRGRVRAPGGTQGLPLTLERRVGRRWRPCGRARSRSGGAFTIACRASGTGRQTFRVRVGPGGGLDVGYSNPVRVTSHR